MSAGANRRVEGGPDGRPGTPELLAERVGDAAVVLRTPHAHALRDALAAAPVPGLLEVVPALGSVTVLFDPLVTDAEAVAREAARRLPRSGGPLLPPGRTLVLPVTFDGPDLPWCAAHADLTEREFVDALCACTLHVAFLGFTPGFAFLTGLHPRLQVPRLDGPRERVPAGSVALGGPWAGVYPRATPGGWRLVGRTDAELLNLDRFPPVAWQAGDRVEFRRD